jgi:hypothetical protein
MEYKQASLSLIPLQIRSLDERDPFEHFALGKKLTHKNSTTTKAREK